jgi:DNA-binding GntR family transcriptional regulator
MKAYQSIFIKIREQIASGSLAAERKIPTEEQLCRTYGVSRITIRQAMKMLEEKGLIERFPGRGSFVRTARQQKIVIQNNDYAGSVSRAVPGIKRKVLMFKEMDAPKHIIDKLKIDKDENCVFAERLDMQDAIPIAFDRVYIPVTYAGRVSREMLEKVDFFDVWLVRDELEFSYATEVIEAIAAGIEISKLLQIPLRSPVLLTTDIIYGVSNKPLAVFESYYNSKHIKIASTAMSRSDLKNHK